MRLGDLDALKENLFIKFGNQLPNGLLEEIDNAPTVEPTFGLFRAMLCETCQAYATNRAIAKLADECTRPQGKWIKIFSNPFTDGYICSVCGHKIQVTEQFLPKVTECEVCGADMRGEDHG